MNCGEGAKNRKSAQNMRKTHRKVELSHFICFTCVGKRHTPGYGAYFRRIIASGSPPIGRRAASHFALPQAQMAGTAVRN
jgi:hypothetical protein